jgi:pseudaminic acid synthase
LKHAEIRIQGRPIGPDHPPYIVAELSANHQGSLEHALATIAEAKRRGADAVKLQTYTADSMTLDCDRAGFTIEGGPWDGLRLYDLYAKASLPYEWHGPIFEFARELGITVFSTPFDEDAVDFLEDLGAPAYKIASFELTDLPLLRRVARTRKPIILSTGLAQPAEIAEALATVRGEGAEELVLLHCISSYPAPMDQANLRRIPALAKEFGTMIGLSDHTLGTSAAAGAIALGAYFIEKHFTLRRADGGPDGLFSIEPAELQQLCEQCLEVWQALGDGRPERQPVEAGNLRFRRSVYFVRDLPAGHVVAAQDIRRIRPGYGLAPRYFDELVGRVLRVGVVRGTPTSWDQFL